ncbi:plastocyanin/azurin family copper-binding protein [Parasedimentitalea psychrophila]|uniref:Plastocyanin/azurin family copper-binding protein n=1 Tax=Parasedimentitalea psychrophila TaxID=2997337 RepID=A0A9Y2L250_9RHOB|nr:plastocyanin/azurin family copper-binding protein [Parasedimentitalea psychrophila]WIY27311.1 plastocyanin/azurin family copper-binding protein [Parasedimentitalea psychrophila]
MKTIVAWLVGAALLGTPALSEDVVVDMSLGMSHEVNQVTDPMATAATGMFRFDPPLVRLEPGEAVVFVNSRGQHTVHSVPQLWSAEMAPISISNKPRVEVRFDEPGVYGMRCNRHGMYGMAMLVIVGGGGGVTSIDESLGAMRASDREKQAFRDLFELSSTQN